MICYTKKEDKKFTDVPKKIPALPSKPALVVIPPCDEFEDKKKLDDKKPSSFLVDISF